MRRPDGSNIDRLSYYITLLIFIHLLINPRGVCVYVYKQGPCTGEDVFVFFTRGPCSDVGDTVGHREGSAPEGFVWFCCCCWRRWCWSLGRRRGLNLGV